MKENEFIARLNNKNFRNKELKMPPLLDKDPLFAASFLTREDSVNTLKIIEEAYQDIEKGNKEKNILTLLLTLSQDNFDWFASFSTAICKLEGREVIRVPYYIKDSLSTYNNLFLCPPLEYSSRRKTILRKKYSINENADAITLWRISYIKENYDLEDFRDNSYPSWYVMTETEIYEGYSSKTNTRVKVTYLNGELNYYIAGASDKWKKIIGVPSEMDHVISALIFRN